MSQIHPTAIVDPRAQIESDVVIGAYSIIKGAVKIGTGTVIHEHSHVHASESGGTEIGPRCEIGPGAFVGLPAQHLKADRNIGWCILGENVVVRETATIHRSITPGREHATRVRDRVFLMAAGHIGHDCDVGNDVVLAHGCMLGGHCVIGEKVFLGGGSGVHQFCRVGRLAIIKGNDAVTQDIPPFAAVRENFLKGYNAVGCRRSGISAASIKQLRAAFRRLLTHRVMGDAIASIRLEVEETPEVRELLEFLTTTKRGILPGLRRYSRTPGDAATLED